MRDCCRKTDIIDHVLKKLEKYANNLEAIVEQRTSELLDEKKKTDMLLNPNSTRCSLESLVFSTDTHKCAVCLAVYLVER